jgi:hypothetical protein
MARFEPEIWADIAPRFYDLPRLRSYPPALGVRLSGLPHRNYRVRHAVEGLEVQLCVGMPLNAVRGIWSLNSGRFRCRRFVQSRLFSFRELFMAK